MNKVEQAISLAVQAHSGQKDKQGKDYFWHVLRVAEKGKTEDEQIVGALHDVLEDCTQFWKIKVKEVVTHSQYEALMLLSRINFDGSKKNTDEYYAAIKTNSLALAVKANDIADNTSPQRIDPLPEKDQEYFRNKYYKAKVALGLIEPAMGVCKKTPLGYQCKLQTGHDGPCMVTYRPDHDEDRPISYMKMQYKTDSKE